MTDRTALSFSTLRMANVQRLPLFKNKHGELAHSRPDGSDWSPAEWFCAMFGEVGEAAQLRLNYEEGRVSQAEYEASMPKELADIQIYLDILSARSLDRLVDWQNDMALERGQGCPFADSPAKTLLHIVAALGVYANTLKKVRRGDTTAEEGRTQAAEVVSRIRFLLVALKSHDLELFPHPDDEVAIAHATGVDLGAAVVGKFNEVSDRVGAPIKIGYQRPGMYVDASWVQFNNPHAGAGDSKPAPLGTFPPDTRLLDSEEC